MARVTYVDQPCKTVLNRVEGMPFKWSVNPYTGCAHACAYCYARAFYTRAERGSAAEFETRIFVKTNAGKVLRAELGKRSWRRELVVVGAATDPYQACEGKFGVTRSVLEALSEARTPVSIITKGTLIVRDIALLQELGTRSGIDVNVTIPTTDPGVSRVLESGAPPPAARMEAVKRLAAAGIPVGVFMAPILPGINDSEAAMRALIATAAEAGARYVAPITLRLGPGVRDWFLPAISRHYPSLTRLYCRLFQSTEAPPEYKQGALGLARAIIAELGLQAGPGKMERAPATATAAQQLRLNL